MRSKHHVIMSVVFVFLDGVGLAPATHDNPLAAAATPALHTILGGPLTLEQATQRTSSTQRMLFKPIDATLGVPGLPQSGTGHTALLAGVNAAALHGRHQPHFPPVALRPLLAEQSIFRQVLARGGRATFANAFGPGYWQALAARRIRKSASVIAAEGAGLRFRDGNDLRDGQAVSWDVTNATMQLREPDMNIPLVHPAEAGANLAALATNHEFVFYESFLPDLAGHGRLTPEARNDTPGIEAQVQAVMALLDGLIGGVLGVLRPGDTVLITSDHGNVESLAEPVHTRNPVPLLAVGPGAAAFAQVEAISGIAQAIMNAL
jgi:hypothetical protein